MTLWSDWEAVVHLGMLHTDLGRCGPAEDAVVQLGTLLSKWLRYGRNEDATIQTSNAKKNQWILLIKQNATGWCNLSLGNGKQNR